MAVMNHISDLRPFKSMWNVKGSLTAHGGLSQQSESNDLTPAKRTRTLIINLEETFD
ncbi:unnamed protein product [Brassica rapa]|uniref:Uncharacterized protein n=1 Tax=Brassica campestris TaxID=3711 RepID=A0A3P6A1A4_BRACM|nr:unnamed protein product [Brassica rapa]VDC80923.1 unnamed protein product [Brassica rapa]